MRNQTVIKNRTSVDSVLTTPSTLSDLVEESRERVSDFLEELAAYRIDQDAEANRRNNVFCPVNHKNLKGDGLQKSLLKQIKTTRL